MGSLIMTSSYVKTGFTYLLKIIVGFVLASILIVLSYALWKNATSIGDNLHNSNYTKKLSSTWCHKVELARTQPGSASVKNLEQWELEIYEKRCALLHSPEIITMYEDISKHSHNIRRTDSFNATLGTIIGIVTLIFTVGTWFALEWFGKFNLLREKLTKQVKNVEHKSDLQSKIKRSLYTCVSDMIEYHQQALNLDYDQARAKSLRYQTDFEMLQTDNDKLIKQAARNLQSIYSAMGLEYGIEFLNYLKLCKAISSEKNQEKFDHQIFF